MLGIFRTTKVVDATDSQGWKFRSCRGRVMQEIIKKIKCVPPPRPEASRDRPLWKQSQGQYEEKYLGSDLINSCCGGVVQHCLVSSCSSSPVVHHLASL
ncbi:hypothetical protein YC2023_081840 [Brassica napus]